MTLIELARLVRQMRALQKEFFTTPANRRAPDLVGRAKAMERQVDRAVDEVLEPPGLFGSVSDGSDWGEYEP
jgi:hypothetical protein